MSLGGCIPGLVKDGKLTREQAEEASAIYDEYIKEFVRTGSPEAAEALASQATIEVLGRQVTRKQFLAGLDVKARQRLLAQITTYRSKGGAGGSEGFMKWLGGKSSKELAAGEGPIDPRALAALVDYDPRAPFSNVEARRKAIRRDANRMMAGYLERHSADITGRVRNKAQLRNIVLELFGEDSGDQAAKELAAAWRETAEMLRRRRNKAGGDTGFRADWGLPQSHNGKKIKAAGFEEWRAFIKERLDLTKMIDRRTGRPFTSESLEGALRDAFDNITSEGRAKQTPGARGGKSMANQRGDPRFFVFENGKGWNEYNERFGSGTAYDAMRGHIDGISRETAAMEVLGPNPHATVDWLKDVVQQSADRERTPGSKASEVAEKHADNFDDLWNEYSGRNIKRGNKTLAKVASGWRALETARKLGAAVLSAPADFGYQMTRRSLNGLQNRTLVPQYLANMMPVTGKAEREFMARRGFVADEYLANVAAQSREVIEELAGEVPRRLSDAVIRAQGLSRHTAAAKAAFQKENLARFTEAAGKSYDQLNKGMRAVLERYGIGASDWDKIRTAPMEHDRGADWITPHKIEDREAADRFVEMIDSEGMAATPEESLRARTLKNKNLRQGETIGELGRTAIQFKTFGITALLRQWQDIAAMPGRATPAKYAGQLFLTTTLMGAVSLQLKALAAGEDPRPMDNLAFWGAAIAQGGGFGIFGDLLRSAETRTGGGFTEALAGPTLQDIDQFYSLISKGVERAVPGGGEGTGLERDATRVAKGMIPGNNLWYIRTAFDRMVADQLQQAVDPNWAQSYQRAQRYAAEQGTQHFWQPGELAPERAPDLGNALEGPQE